MDEFLTDLAILLGNYDVSITASDETVIVEMRGVERKEFSVVDSDCDLDD
jgi:hypothetical protein